MYLNPKVAAGAVVEHRGGIVLLRREIDPRAGFWVHPGGFVDRGETLEQAARRETREEVGLEVEIDRLLGAFSFADSEVVVVTFAAHVISGEPMVGDESLEVRTFAPHEIPWDELAFPSTRLALSEYLRTASVPIPNAPSPNAPTASASTNAGADLRAAVAVSLALASSAAGGRAGVDEKQIEALFEARAAAHAARDVRAASLVYPPLIGHLRAARRHREALVIAEEGLALTHDPLIARLGDEVAHELAALEEERC
jgi:ADP-ribose pyrophosphatase YjhB (NUDIX family)